MITQNPTTQTLTATIPFTDLKELYRYQKAILSLVNEIEPEKCSEEKKKDVTILYQLLGHFMVEGEAANG